MEDFLETNKRSGDIASVEFESGDDQRGTNRPFFFATERTVGCIPDVMGEKANWNGGRV